MLHNQKPFFQNSVDKKLMIFLHFFNNRFNFCMGNVCEFDKQTLQTPARQTIRARSMSDHAENLSLKKLIQLKKIKITQQYHLDDLIGQGTFGCVFKITHKKSKVVRAAKRIQKTKRSIQSLDEFLILKKLDHPNIIRLYDIYSQSKFLYIVTDYCQGGELFDRIIKQGSLTQSEARLYMKQLISGIYHCHTNGIMHRDLKPENIMFLNHKQKDLKIIDFGVGTSFNQSKKKTMKVGSIYYIAPEVIKKKYNQKCDIWSLGIIMYIMLSGVPPFAAKTDKQIYKLILKGQVKFPDQKWNKISNSGRDLIQKMLVVDPEQRISAKQALNHPWIKLQIFSNDEKILVNSDIFSLKNFCQMNQFQSAVMVFISHNFLQNQILSDLQSKFKEFDTNGDGRISFNQFQQCVNEHMHLITEQKIEQMFSKLDKNGSGFIDYSQFITSIIDRNFVKNQGLINQAFDMIDRDKNGYLSREELIDAFGGCNSQFYDYILKEFDVNQDGKISRSQFKSAMKMYAKK